MRQLGSKHEHVDLVSEIAPLWSGMLILEGCSWHAGMYGQSTVRLVDLKTGSVLKSHSLDSSDFGEGLARIGDTCVPLPCLSIYSKSRFT